MLEMMRRLSGLQNIDLVLQEKDAEIKQLRQTIIAQQSKLQDLQEAISGFEHRQSAAVNTDFHPSSGIHHRSSAPEIFVYPDVSKKSGGNNSSEPYALTARGSSATPRDNVKFSRDSKKTQIIQEQHKLSSTEAVNQNGTSLKMDHGIGMPARKNCGQSMGGVSEIYFNNVVSELVKTKQYLYNLQKQMENKVGIRLYSSIFCPYLIFGCE